MNDPKLRFSRRVENYIRYRPTYPEAIIEVLREDCRLTGDSVIADIGSGTGILAELFLRNGNLVFGVEPNGPMREAGERLLRQYPRFRSVAGTAESTTLEDRSVDFVTAGQAFHWFDRERARGEFLRILKPEGWVVLIWNDRRTRSTPFLRAYERLLLTDGPDYEVVNHVQVDEVVLAAFFESTGFKTKVFDNEQVFDYEGLEGRLLSSSYIPEAGHPRHTAMLDELRAIFAAHEENGRVTVEYDTRMYYGRLALAQWNHKDAKSPSRLRGW